LRFETSCMPVGDHTKQAMTTSATPFYALRQRQPMLGLGCLLAGLLLLDPALGQEEGTVYVPPREPVNEYLDAIDHMEAEYGPYATELSDLYLGLGQTLMSSGDYEQARDAFHRGIMVVRVNSGPNSMEQTNHLYLIANIEILLGNLDAADDVLHNIYFANSEYYGENNPEVLPVLERIYQWYLVARPPGSEGVDYIDYKRTIGLTEQMAQINEATKGIEHPDTAQAYRRLGESQFQTYRYLTPSEELEADMFLWNEIPHTRGGLPERPKQHYTAGRKAYDKYVESVLANESSTPLERAGALADLGDWCLVFEKFNTARNLYEQAYQVLAQSEEYAVLADSFMGQPKPVYFFKPTPDLLEDAPMELLEASLDISMTVTRVGRLRYVEVLNAPEGTSEDDLLKIKKLVLETPFRPAMKEGEVVTIKDFIWRYAIVPQGETS
jgi:tetratricopeptide (TPR) repeat protein